MSDLGFLLDEHVAHLLGHRLHVRVPHLRVYAIGDGVAPPIHPLDPDILLWIEANNCLLITNNRASMPVHLTDHLNIGHHVPGIIQLPRRMSIGPILDELLLIWGAGLPDEFRDQIVYLPLRR